MRLVSAAAIGAALCVAAAGAAPTGTQRVGRQADGSVVLPTSQVVRPAGRQVTFPGRAAAVAVHPAGRTAAVLGASGPGVTVVDLAAGRVLMRTASSLGAGAARGIAYAPGGRVLYASFAQGRVLRFPVAADGRLGMPRTFQLPALGTKAEIPLGLAVSADGRRLYVALNRRNALGVLDAATGRLLSAVAVGNAPSDVALAGHLAIVSNGGGRRARPGDRTNDSAGTPIVSHRSTGGAVTGTVSLVDVRTRRVRAHVPVGLHPGGVSYRGRYAFVANANSDTVSVVDLAAGRLATTLSVRPFAGAPYGSSPNAVRPVGADRLAVTLGRNNALAVFRWRSPSEPARFEGLLPTAWYPTDVAVDRRYGRLLVVNSKGTGRAATRDPLGTVTAWPQQASLSLPRVPTPAELAAGLRTVWHDNGWHNAAPSRLRPRRVDPVAVPERIGEPSLIEHVFYVIKENRTYDQVLGDDPRGNGDPRYLHFGAAVTPNHHALARTFALFDNFYVAGTRSPDAHQWATQAIVTDYVEKQYGAFPRSYPYDGGDALAYAPSGFIWDSAARHGRSVRVYGEFANRRDGSGTRSDVPSLDRVLVRRYPPFDLSISDTKRVDTLIADLGKQAKAGTVADLTIVQLPGDHTRGTKPGAPTPESDMADNDDALGRLVEAVSRSPIWPKTAIFVFEDDAQNGLDHVDGHRTMAFVVSPYARRGVVDSTYYTQLSLLRTIEQILGLPPMTQLDLAAAPMTTAFTDRPDLTPYDALPRLVPQTYNPPLTGLTGPARAWAEASDAMDFTVPDAAPEQALNRAIWYSVRGFVPYPGDGRVLWPHEVVETIDYD